MKNILLLTLIFCLGIQVQAQSSKAIFPGDYPDPSILRDGKNYYMTHSPFIMHLDFSFGIPLICCIGSRFVEPYQSMKDLLWHPTC